MVSRLLRTQGEPVWDNCAVWLKVFTVAKVSTGWRMPIHSELSQILGKGKGKRLLPYIISYTPFYSDHLNFLTKTVLNFLIIPQKRKSEELFSVHTLAFVFFINSLEIKATTPVLCKISLGRRLWKTRKMKKHAVKKKNVNTSLENHKIHYLSQ